MNRIDSVGAYRGTISEAAVSLTKKGYPQAVLKLVATQKYVDDKEGMAHFQLTEPSWVDWSSFEEDAVAYLVLFNNTDVFDENSKLLNVDQLKVATGVDLLGGGSFEDIPGTVGKEILFRIQENTYNDKTSLQVTWIDSKDADPNPALRSLDADSVKALNAKLKARKATPKPVAAKPAAKTTTASPKATSAPGAAAPTPTASASATATTKSKAKASPPPKAEPTAVKGLSKSATQTEAWEFVCENKGGNSDSDVEEAWIAATGEVGENKSEDEFTGEDWAKVRDIVIKDLSLSIAA